MRSNQWTGERAKPAEEQVQVTTLQATTHCTAAFHRLRAVKPNAWLLLNAMASNTAVLLRAVKSGLGLLVSKLPARLVALPVCSTQALDYAQARPRPRRLKVRSKQWMGGKTEPAEVQTQATTLQITIHCKVALRRWRTVKPNAQPCLDVRVSSTAVVRSVVKSGPSLMVSKLPVRSLALPVCATHASYIANLFLRLGRLKRCATKFVTSFLVNGLAAAMDPAFAMAHLFQRWVTPIWWVACGFEGAFLEISLLACRGCNMMSRRPGWSCETRCASQQSRMMVSDLLVLPRSQILLNGMQGPLTYVASTGSHSTCGPRIAPPEFVL